MVDLGAGLSWFAPMACQLGVRATIIDDFGGGGGVDIDNRNSAYQIIKKFNNDLGVQVLEQNLLVESIAI